VPLPEALRERLGQETGLLLTRVEPNSPADNSLLVQGDTLVTLAGQPLRSLNDLMQLLDHGLSGDQPEPRLPARVIHAGQVLTRDVQLAERASR
jgi:S1-C subfamily serine protease